MSLRLERAFPCELDYARSPKFECAGVGTLMVNGRFYFTGTFPLVIFAAMPEVFSGYELHHVQSINEYESAEYTSRPIETPRLADAISASLSLGEIYHHEFRWYCPPEHEDGTGVEIRNVPDVQTDLPMAVSTNLLEILSDALQGKRYIAVSEGASDLNLGSVELLRRKLKGSSRLIVSGGLYRLPRYAVDMFLSRTAAAGDRTMAVIDRIASFGELFSALDQLRQGLPFDILYIPTDEVPSQDYLEFLKAQLAAFPDIHAARFLVKPHPRDNRAYSEFFSILGLQGVDTPKEDRVLPAESIVRRYKLKMFGGISTALLHVPPQDLLFSCPLTGQVREFYRNSYRGLLNATGLQI